MDVVPNLARNATGTASHGRRNEQTWQAPRCTIGSPGVTHGTRLSGMDRRRNAMNEWQVLAMGSALFLGINLVWWTGVALTLRILDKREIA